MSFTLSGSLLEGLVLAVVARGDTYGYELTQSLQKLAQISESTLYPVLRRLQKDAYLETYDKPHDGRNRRYYRMTEDGTQKLNHIEEEWAAFKTIIDQLLGGETS